MPDTFTFYGRIGSIVRKHNYTGVSVCWGEGTNSARFTETKYYRPFGVVTPGAITVPTAFPLPVEMGGVPEMAGAEIFGYGTGELYKPWAYCILADGSYYFRGDNVFGQAGDGTTNPANDVNPPAHLDFTLTASLPFSGADIRQVATGPGAVMILLKSGELWGAGGTFTNGTNFHGISGVTSLTTFTKLARGIAYCDTFDDGSAVITEAHRLMVVGGNYAGRFGIAGATDVKYTGWQTVEEDLFYEHGGVKKVRVQDKAVPIAYGSALVLTTDGTLWFSGNNLHRLCGDPDEDENQNFDTFRPVPGIPAIKDFDANGAAVYALDYAGRLWSWGTKTLNPVVSGNATGSPGGEAVVAQPFILLEGVTQIWAAHDHGYAVTGADEVYSWGGGDYSNGGIGHLSGDILKTPHRQGVAVPTLDIVAYNATKDGPGVIQLTSDPGSPSAALPAVKQSVRVSVPLSSAVWIDSGLTWKPGRGLRFFVTGYGTFDTGSYAFPEGAYPYTASGFPPVGLTQYLPDAVYMGDLIDGEDAAAADVPALSLVALVQLASEDPPEVGGTPGAFRTLRELEKRDGLPTDPGAYKVWLIFNDTADGFADNVGAFEVLAQVLK